MSKAILACVLLLLVGQKLSAADDQLNLKYVDHQQWTAQLQQYQPNIVVVDFWATWCSSCLERFPHMVEMNRAYQKQGVQFVSMLLEDPEEPEAIARAKQFLLKQEADFDHYFMTENLMVSFEKLDLLGIPAVFIYDQQGRLAHRLTGDNPNNQFTETDIKNTLDQMLQNHTP